MATIVSEEEWNRMNKRVDDIPKPVKEIKKKGPYIFDKSITVSQVTMSHTIDSDGL